MSPYADLFDVGGTPHQNAALGLIMVAAMGAGHTGPGKHLVGPPAAASVIADLLRVATAAGFQHAEEFRALAAAENMTPRMENLAMELVTAAGGPDRVFNVLAMAVLPAGELGARQ